MRLIFYQEATKILGVSYQTLLQAVSRGELTRAGVCEGKQQLIGEQVRLFVGNNPRTGKRKQLSYNKLSEEDKVKWNTYAEQANQPRTIVQKPRIVQPSPDSIRKMIQEELARQEIARIQEEEEIDARKAKIRSHQKERLTKDYPFLMRELTA